MLGIPVYTKAYRRVRSGIHVDAAQWRTLAPWQRYQVRVHAFVLAHPDSVLCLESAAVILGLPYFGEPRDIHVFDAARTASRRFGDVAVHTSASPRTVVEIEGVRVTCMLDTVVDLIRALPPAQGLAVGDAAISAARGGPLRLDDLRAATGERVDRRGSARAGWVLDHADGDAESAGESLSRAVAEWCGFETPMLQCEFRYEGALDRVDFFFPRSNVIGESDGWGKYTLDNPERAASRLAAEKRREDRLRRAGHGFARWDLSDAQRVEPLHRALRAASVQLVRPAQNAMLLTLTRSARSA